MGAPIATPSELGQFLGQTISDGDLRALLILSLAQARCELWATPLPDAAKGVVLSVAGRAWTNAASANQIGMGSAYATLAHTGAGGVGGLYVSRSERRDLRRMAGRSGAFSVDWLPQGRSDVQAVIVEATEGTYTLTLDDTTTDPVAFDATSVQVQAALETVAGAGNVSVADGFLITFKGALANTAVGTLVADDSLLTGTVTVVTVQQGQPSPRDV